MPDAILADGSAKERTKVTWISSTSEVSTASGSTDTKKVTAHWLRRRFDSVLDGLGAKDMSFVLFLNCVIAGIVCGIIFYAFSITFATSVFGASGANLPKFANFGALAISRARVVLLDI